jgi:hypothetical protein
MSRVLDFEVLKRSDVGTDPFMHTTGDGLVRPEAVESLQASFPRIETYGYQTLENITPEGTFAELLEELRSQELAEVLGEKFGRDYVGLPRLITVRRLSAAHEGHIHCDSEKKVMSLLIYLNDSWDAPGGRLRLLRREDSFDDYAVEVTPKTGTFLAFPRTDDSWHGHTSFAGERRAVQVAWLRSQADLDRKTKSHRFKRAMKRIFSPNAGEPVAAM